MTWWNPMSWFEDEDDGPDPDDPNDERNYDGFDTDPGNKFGPSYDEDENPGGKFDYDA